jgi:DNA-binding response OmpR family regulator
MAKILVVDDDAHIRALIHFTLQEEGHEVEEAANGREALQRLEKISFDLVVFDLMMPVMDGWDLCRELREHYDLPLLIVTAKGASEDKVKGFKLGTDDYLIKPFDPVELAFRVKALLRRYHIASSQVIQVGDVALDRGKLEVRGAGADAGQAGIVLPLKEFELLYKLAGYPGQIFTRVQLIDKIWGPDYSGEERTVDVHIKRVREKLEAITDQVAIVTIRGLGYKIEVKHD